MSRHPSPGLVRAILRPTGFPAVRIEEGPRGLLRVEFMTGNRRGAMDREKPSRGGVSALSLNFFERYFQGDRVDFKSLRTDRSLLTPFQRAVYRVLETIPYGEVRTYGWIASNIGKPLASRAVGRAVGANPLPIVWPCHRVVAANGLGGFSCGLDIKRRLLELEGIDFSLEKR